VTFIYSLHLRQIFYFLCIYFMIGALTLNYLVNFLSSSMSNQIKKLKAKDTIFPNYHRTQLFLFRGIFATSQ